MSARLLVLGLDAISPPLLLRLASEGRLPAIRSLMERGMSGTVRGLRGFFIGSTWPSFYTGLDPAGHGVHRIEQLRPGSYEFFRPLDLAADVGGRPFWEVASDAGRRVAVLDVPLSRLAPELNGVQTVEWGGHDPVFGFRTWPPDLAAEVLDAVGPYPLPPRCDVRGRTAQDFERFVAGLEQAVLRKAELTRRVLSKENWDLVVQVFTESHCAGHQCWHLHDRAHPAHDPALRERLSDPLERVYCALDAAVGAILAEAGSDHVLLVSAHGMGPTRGAEFLLPELLQRLGVTAPRRDPAPATRALKKSLRRSVRAAWQLLPEGVRHPLRPRSSTRAPERAARRRGPSLPRMRADPRRSRCFPVPNGSPVAGIRLNLVGREPRGLLRPGAESDAFCDSLARDLCAIVDERTGRPLVADVVRTDTLYTGPCRDGLPDLLVEFAPDTARGSLAHAGGRDAAVVACSPRVGRIEAANRLGRTGEHVPDGFFALAGPGIAGGIPAADVSVMDFHPTLCRLLGLPDPDVGGRVIPAVSSNAGGRRPEPGGGS